jgi:HK97 family phage major capsid protein
MYHYIDVSQQDLEDAQFDIEGFLRSMFAEEFAKLEATAFVSDNGVGKPQGFLVHPDIAHTASGHASQLTADGLITCFYDLKDGHARNGTWVLKRSSIAAIRKLKDGTGNYIWAPGLGLTDAAGPSILGAPYVEAVDMPAVSAGLKAVAFGDFRRYQIVDRVGTTVLRDPYSAAGTGCIRFHARRRVGGQTLLAEAIRCIIVEAS